MKNILKTSISGLTIGMYVSKLDRPWIKTPFLLEGILIKTNEDIEMIRRYCSYVYVDIEKGSTPNVEYWITDETKKYKQSKDDVKITSYSEESSKKLPASKGNHFDALRRRTYVNTTDVMDEIKAAKAACNQLGDNFKTLLTDVKLGKNIDLEIVKKGVLDMVDSIVRNPSASMWVLQMRKHDDYLYSRALGNSVWCAMFARHLGLERDGINNLALGGLLLDIGKTKIPGEIMNKKGELTMQEKKVLRAHVNIGVKMLIEKAQGVFPHELLAMVATHHERHNGTGYPQKMDGDKIPLYGKIAGIVDTYDAMTTKSPYSEMPAMSPHKAISGLYKYRDTKFQAELIEQFIQAVGIFPTGTLVELSTGEVGAVTAVNGLRRLRPSVMVLLDKDKKPMPSFVHLDLARANSDIRIMHGVNPEKYGIDLTELFL